MKVEIKQLNVIANSMNLEEGNEWIIDKFIRIDGHDKVCMGIVWVVPNSQLGFFVQFQPFQHQIDHLGRHS